MNGPAPAPVQQGSRMVCNLTLRNG